MVISCEEAVCDTLLLLVEATTSVGIDGVLAKLDFFSTREEILPDEALYPTRLLYARYDSKKVAVVMVMSLYSRVLLQTCTLAPWTTAKR
jgi:hypothetical protein